ncbi:MAG: hypothetical protein MHM6MM_008358, partial [Cercozoa sp. M6MM]
MERETAQVAAQLATLLARLQEKPDDRVIKHLEFLWPQVSSRHRDAILALQPAVRKLSESAAARDNEELAKLCKLMRVQGEKRVLKRPQDTRAVKRRRTQQEEQQVREEAALPVDALVDLVMRRLQQFTPPPEAIARVCQHPLLRDSRAFNYLITELQTVPARAAFLARAAQSTSQSASLSADQSVDASEDADQLADQSAVKMDQTADEIADAKILKNDANLKAEPLLDETLGSDFSVVELSDD